jgi:hypothetical protein
VKGGMPVSTVYLDVVRGGMRCAPTYLRTPGHTHLHAPTLYTYWVYLSTPVLHVLTPGHSFACSSVDIIYLSTGLYLITCNTCIHLSSSC